MYIVNELYLLLHYIRAIQNLNLKINLEHYKLQKNSFADISLLKLGIVIKVLVYTQALIYSNLCTALLYIPNSVYGYG